MECEINFYALKKYLTPYRRQCKFTIYAHANDVYLFKFKLCVREKEICSSSFIQLNRSHRSQPTGSRWECCFFFVSRKKIFSFSRKFMNFAKLESTRSINYFIHAGRARLLIILINKLFAFFNELFARCISHVRVRAEKTLNEPPKNISTAPPKCACDLFDLLLYMKSKYERASREIAFELRAR